MVSTGTNALLAYGRNATRNMNPLAASGVLTARPRGAGNPQNGRDDPERRADGGQPAWQAGMRPEADEAGHAEHQDGGCDVARDARRDVAGQDRRAADAHGPELVDDPAGHVLADAHG